MLNIITTISIDKVDKWYLKASTVFRFFSSWMLHKFKCLITFTCLLCGWIFFSSFRVRHWALDGGVWKNYSTSSNNFSSSRKTTYEYMTCWSLLNSFSSLPSFMFNLLKLINQLRAEAQKNLISWARITKKLLSKLRIWLININLIKLWIHFRISRISHWQKIRIVKL